jgi:hypothetical protein
MQERIVKTVQAIMQETIPFGPWNLAHLWRSGLAAIIQCFNTVGAVIFGTGRYTN